MIAFDSYTNTYTSGFMPSNVSEIVCDNSLIAKSRYSTTGKYSHAVLNFKLYPNPVSDVLNLEFTSNGQVK